MKSWLLRIHSVETAVRALVEGRTEEPYEDNTLRVIVDVAREHNRLHKAT